MKTQTFSKASALLVAFYCVTPALAAVDRSFKPGTGINGGDETSGNVVVPLADGRILLGGDFGTYNGVPRPDLVLLHANGSLDPTLHLAGGVNGPDEPAIRSAGFQPDGKIIVSGNFTVISGVTARIARLHPDGTLDTTWVPQFRHLTGGVYRSTVLSDGPILAWNPLVIERLNADGSADTSFNAALDGLFLTSVSLQADGRVLLAGTVFFENRPVAQKLARLHADGSADMSFASPRIPGSYGLNGARQMPDGRILVFGSFGSVDGRARPGLALLHPDGRLDTTARFDGTPDVVQAWPLSDGSIIAFSAREPLYPNGFAVTVFTEPSQGQRRKGHPWKIEFTIFPNGYVTDMSEDTRGRILIAGEFYAINGVRSPTGIARLRRK